MKETLKETIKLVKEAEVFNKTLEEFKEKIINANTEEKLEAINSSIDTGFIKKLLPKSTYLSVSDKDITCTAKRICDKLKALVKLKKEGNKDNIMGDLVVKVILEKEINEMKIEIPEDMQLIAQILDDFDTEEKNIDTKTQETTIEESKKDDMLIGKGEIKIKAQGEEYEVDANCNLIMLVDALIMIKNQIITEGGLSEEELGQLISLSEELIRKRI